MGSDTAILTRKGLSVGEVAVQGPPLAPEKPVLQEQSICSLLASGPLEFVGHSWHTSEVAPTNVEY